MAGLVDSGGAKSGRTASRGVDEERRGQWPSRAIAPPRLARALARAERLARESVQVGDGRVWLQAWRRVRALAGDVRRSFLRVGWPTDERSAAKAMRSSLVLHLLAPEIRGSTLRLAQTWGLGVAGIVLLMVLAVTGISLMFHYVPHVDAAYRSMKELAFVVPYGRLIRNMHRWSAHAIVVAVTAHMARVFLCGAYKSPREANWVAGVALWVLTLALAFTGYLLPWDQRSFWSIAAMADLAATVPVIGNDVRMLVRGDAAAGGGALLRFYVLHCIALPIAVAGLTSFHLWRVRGDGGLLVAGRTTRQGVRFPRRLVFVFSEGDATRSAVTTNVSSGGLAVESERPLKLRTIVHGSIWLPGGRPVSCTLQVLWARVDAESPAVLGGRFVAAPPPVYEEYLHSIPPPIPSDRAPPPPPPFVPAWPHLVVRVLALALAVVAGLLLLSLGLDAPLTPEATASRPIDPAKAPWFLLGVQELAHHSAFWGGLIVPLATVAGLALLPYLDWEARAPGRYFAPERRIATRAFAVVVTTAAVLTFVGGYLRGPGWSLRWWPS